MTTPICSSLSDSNRADSSPVSSNPVISNPVISNPVISNIVSLSLGQLCADERAKLVDAILSNPETAALAKLGMRVTTPAQRTASAFVAASNSHSKLSKSGWNARNLVTGACASLALLAMFSFSERSVQTVETGQVAMNQVQNNDHFGTPGSFEGSAGLNRPAVNDSFGSGGFEAN